MIQLKDLTLGYEQRTLLEKVSAHITGGQLVALLGRNGTGKSTLLRAVMGLEKPQNGEIILHGNNIASLKPEELARNIRLRHHRQSAHCQPAMQRRRRTGTCSLYQLARSGCKEKTRRRWTTPCTW
ncbi:ATP-binding cassette domain-containing protein [Bacteroides thetaiotaomicron]|nr:ATP-binding cassette domain-containing protein [Bacteroides thetaiotaomicron]